MPPATILHLITGLASGGAEMMLYKLVSGMDRQRFRPVVVSLTTGGAVAERIADLGIPVHSLGMRRGQPTPQSLWWLATLLRRERPAILQTWLYHADLLGLLVAPLAGGMPVIWNVRSSNMDMSHYSRLSAWTVRACARLSQHPRAVVINSATGRAFHERSGYRPREWALIPNGFDLQQFRPDAAARAATRAELGIPPDAFAVGLMARRDPMKDHPTFLRAAALLRHRHPEVHFILAGQGVTSEDPELRRLIEAGDLGAHAHLLGERRDMPQLLAALDVASLTSTFGEGFPNVVGEAMACAVPCVVTDAGDAAAIVGDTGFVVPFRDPAAIAAAWERLIDLPPEERQALATRARQRVAEHYSLAAIIGQYEDLYARFAGR